MHSHSLDGWTHDHVFLGDDHARNERRTWLVVVLTAGMMIVEIAGGAVFGSMALVADGWHMSTHAGALAIAALAYRFARTHARDRRLTFGTGKVGELAAFASAIVLAMIALLIGYESLTRLVAPVSIEFGQAMPIAVVGLMVNLASAWLLGGGHHHHGHAHGHEHGHHHPHDHTGDHGQHRHSHDDAAGASHRHAQDTNLRAAYIHVLADALTSVLAILALAGGRYLGLGLLDPLMGVVGAAVILSWSASLVRSSGAVLLDVAPESGVEADIRARLERDGDRISDLHVWQVGPGHRAAVISLVTDAPQPPAAYKARLAGLHRLSHVTVEVQRCLDHLPA